MSAGVPALFAAAMMVKFRVSQTGKGVDDFRVTLAGRCFR